MSTQTQQPLPLPVPSQDEGATKRTAINAHCSLQTEAGQWLVTVRGIAMWTFAEGDTSGRALAMVQLVQTGAATQVEVARAFGCTTRTVRRQEERYTSGGMLALGLPPGRRPGAVGVARVQATAIRRVRRWKEQGESNRQIGHRLGICEKSVRKLLRRMGWLPPPSAPVEPQLTLPLEPAAPPAVPIPAGPSPPPETSASPPAEASAVQATMADEERPVTADLPSQALQPTSAEDQAATGACAPTAPAPSSEPNSTPAPPAGSPAPERTAAVGNEEEEPVPQTLDHDPHRRTMDRLLAYKGMLDDAAPLFASGLRVPHAGVLLALPVLTAVGVLQAARQAYGAIGPAFFGLRSTLLTLLFMALLRIGRAEALKEHIPADLGRLMGLDRAPEVKTLRRKLQRFAQLGGAERFGQELARRRASLRGKVLGFLYVDGHVRVYHGKRRLPQAHVARMRIAMPATTDYWVNDCDGEPLFVVTAPANAGLLQMLPGLLERCRPLLGRRKATVAFDRGGYSPKYFRQILRAGFDFLTYRKRPSPAIDEGLFQLVRQRIDGRLVEYRLHDGVIWLLDRKLMLRQVTRLKDGHQTPILTSRWDISAATVAYRMFERWRQENYFKYMRQEYLIDALVDYQVEEDNPQRMVPNPERKKLDKEVASTRQELARLQQEYGQAALAGQEGQPSTKRGDKTDLPGLAEKVRLQQQKLAALRARRATVPKRVTVAQVSKAAVLKLAPERKRFTDLIKMVAYQAESDLLSLIRPHYARADQEGRTLVQNILANPADLEVTATELHVRVAPLSSPHRTKALAALCAELDETRTVFPGTRLTLRFSVAE